MRNLLVYAKKYKWLFIGAVLLLFISNFSALFIPTLTANIINIGVKNQDFDYIYRIGIIMIVTSILGGISGILAIVLSSKFSSCFARDVREAMIEKSHTYSINDFQKIGVASLVTRATSDVTVLQRSSIMFLLILLPVPIMSTIGIALAFTTDFQMGLIFLSLVVIFGIVAYFIGKKAVPLIGKLRILMDKLTYVLREIITGTRVIRAFNCEEYESKRFEKSCTDYYDIAVKTNKVFVILMPTLILLLNLGIVLILLIAGYEISQGIMEVGNIFALIQYLTLILLGGFRSVFVFMEMPRLQACTTRINAVLELKPEISDKNSKSVVTKQSGVLEFDNVTFQYTGAEKPVLHNITFSVNPGETVAVIGGTGSGKSTIAKLIPRFFDIQNGKISVNGVNIIDYPQKELRSKIGFVPQTSFLFHGTIESNIKFGKNNATDEEIIHASKIAQADTFIQSLENGYNSFVAQGGKNLSGGQRQRVAIARALVRKPEIYVFDDSFSALDFKTDANLRNALKSETKKSAVLIIAQRINTILNATRIVVLDEGNVAGIGNHEELMKSCDIYRQIAYSQLSEEELKRGGAFSGA